MKITFDQMMIVLAGLTAACERSSPEIVPESPAQTAGGVSAVPEAARNSAAPPAPPKAAPTASTVVAKEVARTPKPPPGAPAGSATAKEKGCAPGGCAPGKCG